MFPSAPEDGFGPQARHRIHRPVLPPAARPVLGPVRHPRKSRQRVREGCAACNRCPPHTKGGMRGVHPTSKCDNCRRRFWLRFYGGGGVPFLDGRTEIEWDENGYTQTVPRSFRFCNGRLVQNPLYRTVKMSKSLQKASYNCCTIGPSTHDRVWRFVDSVEDHCLNRGCLR